MSFLSQFKNKVINHISFCKMFNFSGLDVLKHQLTLFHPNSIRLKEKADEELDDFEAACAEEASQFFISQNHKKLS